LIDNLGSKLKSPIKTSTGEITGISFNQGESRFSFTHKGKELVGYFIDGGWEIGKLNEKGNYNYINYEEIADINKKYGSQKEFLQTINKELVNDIENFEKLKYTKEEIDSDIISLENSISKRADELRVKYGNTYLLQDFLKEYDAELKTLEEQSTSAKKADIERRRQEVERLSNKELTSSTGKINTGKIEIPILPSQNIDKTLYKDGKGVEYKVKANFKNLQDVLLGRNGKYLFRGMQGRFFVLAKVGDFYLPFYISSAGTSGKKQGEWYPFFGYTGNWLVKGRVGNKGEMEYSQKISEVQKLLQENLQFPSRFLNLKGEMKVGDNVIYDINQDFNYIEHFTTFGDGTVKREGDKYPILKETLWIQEITGFDPRNVDNDGKGSADAWINDIIALIENAPLASKDKINAKYNEELKASETKKAEIERRRQERLKNSITNKDKIVFGHPTIGKSYLKQRGNSDFITLDDDYAEEVNAFVDKNRGSETRQEYKGRKPKEYNEFMLNLFDRLKIQAQKEGKRLFVSNTNILKERMSEFDKVITIPKDEFKKRFDVRGATYGFEDWKSDIDATIAKVDKSKVINTTDYLSDLFQDKINAKYYAERIEEIEERRQKELLGKSFTETTEKVVMSKGQSNGKTIVRFTESKISSDSEVLIIKPKAKFKNEDTSLSTTPETITVKEFREQFYENLSEQDKEMFDELFTDDSIRIKLVEARIGLKGNAKGQVNIDVESLEGQPFAFELQNGKEINAKYDAEIKALKIQERIESELPKEIADAITYLSEVPEDILGRDDLYLSIKEILNDNNINDEILINWIGINKDSVGHPKNLKSEQQVLDLIQKRLKEKQKESNYLEFQKNPLALESFGKWKDALKDFPLPFQEIMLTHALKWMNNPDRRSKYVLQLSNVALQNAYGIVVNKPHELNRIGKLYDQEVLKTISDAVEHEPSASGKGHWVHIPKTENPGLYLVALLRRYKSYEDFEKESKRQIKTIPEFIKALEEKLNHPTYYKNLKEKLEELENKPINFYSQESHLTIQEKNEYGFKEYDYVRVESSYSRGSNPHEKFLGKNYEGYYIHGYNALYITDTRNDRPSTKILPITKEQAEKIWRREIEEYPINALESKDRNDLLNLKDDIAEYEPEKLKKSIKDYQDKLTVIIDNYKNVKPGDWDVENNYKANVELLRKLSPSTWCTADGMTNHYVENYDNYLLIVDGVTVVGIEAGVAAKPKYTELPKDFTINEKHYYIKDGKYFEDSKELPKDEFEDNQEVWAELNPIEKTPKIQVKEVTSRANNGIASIEHLDDTIAFFEKHNLDLDNPSVKRALQLKEEGKTDKDISKEPEFDEAWGYEEAWGDEGYEWEPEIDGMELQWQNDRDIRQLLSTFTTPEDYLVLVGVDQSMWSYFDALPQQLRDSEIIASKAVEEVPHNIAFISTTLPFYNDLATKSINLYPQAFVYLPDDVKEEREDLRAIYEASEAERDDDLPFSKTNDNTIEGYYDAKNDKVVLITSNIKPEEAAKVAIHEVAHRGMLRMAKELGRDKELFEVLSNSEEQLMEKLPELLKRTGHTSLENLMLDYGFDANSQDGKFKLLQELAARWAETLVDKPKPVWWKNLLKNIGKWISKFTGKTLNEKEVNELVGGFVKYGTQNINKEAPTVEQEEENPFEQQEPTVEANPELEELKIEVAEKEVELDNAEASKKEKIEKIKNPSKTKKTSAKTKSFAGITEKELKDIIEKNQNFSQTFSMGQVFRTASGFESVKIDGKEVVNKELSEKRDAIAKIKHLLSVKERTAGVPLNQLGIYITLKRDSRDYYHEPDKNLTTIAGGRETTYFSTVENSNIHPVVAVLTDKNGKDLFFNEKGEIAEQGYTIAEQVFEVLDTKFRTKEERIKERTEQRLVAMELDNFYTLTEEDKKELSRDIKKEVEKEFELLAKVKDFVRAGNTITISDFNVSPGFAEKVEYEVTTVADNKRLKNKKVELQTAKIIDLSNPDKQTSGFAYIQASPQEKYILEMPHLKEMKALIEKLQTEVISPKGEFDPVKRAELLERRRFLLAILYQTVGPKTNKNGQDLRLPNDPQGAEESSTKGIAHVRINERGKQLDIVTHDNTPATELNLRVNVDKELLDGNNEFVEFYLDKKGNVKKRVWGEKQGFYQGYLKSIAKISVPLNIVEDASRRYNVVFGFNPAETVNKMMQSGKAEMRAPVLLKVALEPVGLLNKEEQDTLARLGVSFKNQAEFEMYSESLGRNVISKIIQPVKTQNGTKIKVLQFELGDVEKKTEIATKYYNVPTLVKRINEGAKKEEVVKQPETKSTKEKELKEAEEKWAQNVDERGYPKEALPPILKAINDKYKDLEETVEPVKIAEITEEVEEKEELVIKAAPLIIPAKSAKKGKLFREIKNKNILKKGATIDTLLDALVENNIVEKICKI
jgi:hypothetical protein